MKILIDTCIWSLALRRQSSKLDRTETMLVNELTELIKENRVIILGPIRQEILSGIKDIKKYNKVREILKAFPDYPIITENFELAARFFNKCRSKGMQGSNIDFLLCAVASSCGFSIFTSDKDFLNFSKCIDVNLHNLRTKN